VGNNHLDRQSHLIGFRHPRGTPPGGDALQIVLRPGPLSTAFSPALTGSWMNDNGFWIVARMSALTEVEALKTWTILLAILGVTALGFTLLAVQIYPLG
jgi:hypothetical protein